MKYHKFFFTSSGGLDVKSSLFKNIFLILFKRIYVTLLSFPLIFPGLLLVNI